jgi:hypothetical protein
MLPPVASEEPGQQVPGRGHMDGLNLFTVPVIPVAVVGADEHERRRSSGCGAFTDLTLLTRELGLPLGVAVDCPRGGPPEYGNLRVVSGRCSHGG